MRDAVEFYLPISTKVRGDGGKVLVATLLDVSVPQASPDELVDVVAFKAEGHEGPQFLQAWNGGLVGRNVYSPMSDLVGRSKQDLQENIYSKTMWFHPKDNPWGGIWTGLLPEKAQWVEDASAFPELCAERDRVLDIVRRCVVVGGELYQPTLGPMVRLFVRVGTRIETEISEPEYRWAPSLHTPWFWSAFDATAIREKLSEAVETYSDMLHMPSGTLPTVISESGWEKEKTIQNFEREAIEKTMWHLRNLRPNVPLRNATIEQIQTLTDLHEVHDANVDDESKIGVALDYIDCWAKVLKRSNAEWVRTDLSKMMICQSLLKQMVERRLERDLPAFML